MKIGSASENRPSVAAEQQRAKARATLMRLQREMAEQNRDLTTDEAAKLARRTVDDTMEELVRQGKIRFAEPNDQTPH